MTVKPIPDGYHTVTPYLIVRGAEKAIAFYQDVFGATEVMRLHGPHGTIAHAELQFGDARVMLAEENVEWGAVSPTTLGGSLVGLLLYVADVDTTFAKAVQAGATVKRPVADQFYGDRTGTVTDPFGHNWTLATHMEDVSNEEMSRRLDAMRKQMAGA